MRLALLFHVDVMQFIHKGDPQSIKFDSGVGAGSASATPKVWFVKILGKNFNIFKQY